MIRFGILGFGLHAVKRLMPGFAGAKRCRVSAGYALDELISRLITEDQAAQLAAMEGLN